MLESEIKTQNLSFNDVGLIIYGQKEKNKTRGNLSRIRSLERRLDRVNHIMELIRTVIPLLVLLINLIILLKIFDLI